MERRQRRAKVTLRGQKVTVARGKVTENRGFPLKTGSIYSTLQSCDRPSVVVTRQLVRRAAVFQREVHHAAFA